MSLSDYGSIASIAGALIGVVGFSLTLMNVARTRSAAARAENSAQQVLRRVQLYDLLSDITQAISLVEELKRIHRLQDWKVTLERYAELKKVLIAIRDTSVDLTEEQQSQLQGAITNLSDIEDQVERALEKGTSVKQVHRINGIMTKQAENLYELLIQIRAKEGS